MQQRLVKLPQCAECNVKNKICTQEDGHGPNFCPTINLTRMVKDSLTEYERPEIKGYSIQESECYANRGKQHPYIVYPVKTRIQETIEFATFLAWFGRLDYSRIYMG